MTIDKAIHILEIETGSRHLPSDPDLYNAMVLGIEALKRLQAERQGYSLLPTETLPGETEEVK